MLIEVKININKLKQAITNNHLKLINFSNKLCNNAKSVVIYIHDIMCPDVFKLKFTEIETT